MVLGKGPTSFFSMRISSFPSIIVEKSVLSPLNGLGVKNHICRSLSLGPLVFSVGASAFMQVLHCSDYCRFSGSLETRKCESSSFVLFPDCFTYWGPLRRHWILG